MTKELEEYAIDIIKNHSHRLVKNFTETDLINRELTIFYDGYKKGLERQIRQTLELCKENRELEAQLSDEESLKRLCDKGLIAEKNGVLPGKLSKAKDIVQTLVNCIRVLSDPKVELTDIDAFLADAEEFLKEDESC